MIFIPISELFPSEQPDTSKRPNRPERSVVDLPPKTATFSGHYNNLCDLTTKPLLPLAGPWKLVITQPIRPHRNLTAG